MESTIEAPLFGSQFQLIFPFKPGLMLIFVKIELFRQSGDSSVYSYLMHQDYNIIRDMAQNLTKLLEEAQRNPFVCIDLKFEVHIQKICAAKTLNQEDCAISHLRENLQKDSLIQLETLVRISKESERIVKDLLPDLLMLQKHSPEIQIQFSSMAMLAVCLRRVKFEECELKRNFIEACFVKIASSSSQPICLMSISILSKQQCSYQERLSMSDLREYFPAYSTKVVQEAYINLAAHYAFQTGRPFLSEWEDIILQQSRNTSETFKKDLLEILCRFSSELTYDFLSQISHNTQLISLEASLPPCQLLLLRLAQILSERMSSKMDRIVLKILFTQEKNINLLSNLPFLDHLVPTLLFLTADRQNCEALLEQNHLLNAVFLVFVSSESDFDERFLEISLNLLKKNLSFELKKLFDQTKLVNRIYSIIYDYLDQNQGREYYFNRALTIAKETICYQQCWRSDSRRRLLLIAIAEQFSSCIEWTKQEDKWPQMVSQLMGITTVLDSIFRGKLTSVYPLSAKNICQIYYEQGSIAILFHSPLAKEVLAEAFNEAAVTWRVDKKKTLIFTDIPTEAEHYGRLAQYIKIDFNKSPIVVIDGAKMTKYVLSKAPVDITSADIIAFVGNVENGTAKEYKIDQGVEYEGVVAFAPQ